jgi:MFS transporter, DHA1 family, inner membrane transport protein
MDKRIAALAFATFAMGTEAFVYAGHLEALARDLATPVASAGQLAAAFALTAAISGPFVAAAVARLDRRTMIATGLVLIGGLNLTMAVLPTFEGLLALRVLCGLAAGLVGPIASVAVAELTTPDNRGKAMALTVAGVTLAFVLGVPVGSVIGDHAGWRGTFAYAGLIALLAAAVTRLVLPALPGSPRRAAVNYGLIAQPGIVRGLALTLIGFAAAFTIVAYIGPLATAIAGLRGSGIAAVQALIGVGSIAGIVLGGRMAGGPSAARVLWVSFAVAVISSLSYAVLLTLPVTAQSLSGGEPGETARVPWLTLVVFVTGMVVGAGALFTRIPIIQTDLANASPLELRPVVFGLNGSMVLFGQGLGAAVGGVAISAGGGLFALGLAASGLALVGCLVALGAAARPVRPSPTVARS